MDHIPPLAWVGIAFIAVITVVINLGMIAMLRSRKPYRARMPRSSPMAINLKKFREVLRDPFAEERKQLDELSNLVHRFPETPGEDSRADTPADKSRNNSTK